MAFIIPDETPEAGGNWIYARRLQVGLGRLGIKSTITRVSDPIPSASIYHAFNAIRTAIPLLARGVAAQAMIVTWTGTDIWSDAGQRREDVLDLSTAVAHTTLTTQAADVLVRRFPDWTSRIYHVAPAVDVERFSPRGDRVDTPHPLFVLVGGGRAEKGTVEAIRLVARVRDCGTPATLALLGPARDAKYWAKVQSLCRDLPWIMSPGTIATEDMPTWYRAADLVINTSWVEGVSNALLEALACGRPVLARDIPGNRSVIAPDSIGWLFETDESFCDWAQHVLVSPSETMEVGVRARQAMQIRFHPDREIEEFLVCYREICSEIARALPPCRR